MMRLKLIGLALVILTGLVLAGCKPPQTPPVTTSQPLPSSTQPTTTPAPWAKCGEGTWILIERLNPETMEPEKVKDTLTKITDNGALIITELKTETGWKKIDERTESLTPQPLSPPGPKQTESTKIKNKDYLCEVVSPPDSDKNVVVKMWMCGEIPGRLVRKEMNSVVVWQVIDFERK